MKLRLRDSTESRTVPSIHDGYMKVNLLGVRNDGFFDFRRRISTVGAIAQGGLNEARRFDTMAGKRGSDTPSPYANPT